MKKYVLTGGPTPEHFIADAPSAINEKIALLQAEGADLKDFSVTAIDTEKYPPVTRTAEEWIKLTTPAATDEAGQVEKNRFKRTVGKIEAWLRNTFHTLLKGK